MGIITDAMWQVGHWVKTKTIKLWKIIVTTIIGAAVLATATQIASPPQPPEGPYQAPGIEVNGEIIKFLYTDDNADENLIISTDRKVYSGVNFLEADVYVAVDNKSGEAQAINLASFFSKGDRKMTSIEALVKDVTPYDCSYEVITPEGKTELYEKTCTDKWVGKKLSSFVLSEYESLIGNVKIKSKKGFEAKKIFPFLLDKDKIAFFRAHIEFPPKIEDEFFIEVIGAKDSYGHLDPTINSNILKEDWNSVTGWTEAGRVNCSNSISPAGQLYLECVGGTAAANYELRSQDIGSLGDEDYWFKIRAKADEWDTYGDPASATLVGIRPSFQGATYLLSFFWGNDHSTEGDGLWVEGSSTNKVHTTTWDNNFHIVEGYVHNGQTDVDIWVDGTKVATDADSTASTATDGTVQVMILSRETPNADGEYHVDYLYLGTRGRRIIIIN